MGLFNRGRGLRSGGGTCHLGGTVSVYMCKNAIENFRILWIFFLYETKIIP